MKRYVKEYAIDKNIWRKECLQYFTLIINDAEMLELIDAKYIKDYTVFLTFYDGQSGEIDLSYLITDKGVFSKFKDLNFFKNFKVCSESGTITWRDEIDIAPESLHSKVTGIIPDWAEA